MVLAPKLRLSRCVKTVVCTRLMWFTYSLVSKALNFGCCHVVGDLGVQAEAQYLSCNLRGVKRPVFEAVEQSLQYRTFVVLPMGDMKRSFFAEINMHQFESQFRFVYVGVMEQGGVEG